MGKKSFKGGIGDLLKESFEVNKTDLEKKLEQDKTEALKRIEWLERKLKVQNQELKKWRTGKMNTKLFNSSLSIKDLKYNPENNSFEIIKKKK
jgi:hypothetical protein